VVAAGEGVGSGIAIRSAAGSQISAIVPSPTRLRSAKRKPDLSVFLGIKLREVLADNFDWKASLETPRTGVPARHYAGRVQHVDSVVRDSLDQKAIASIVYEGGGGGFHKPLHPRWRI
jgi:hypothetical protein